MLTPEQIALCKQLKSNYISAVIQRGKNPADFDSNVECLRQFSLIVASLLEILKPFMGKGGLLKMNNFETFRNQVLETIIDEEVHTICRRTFSRERRVSGLNAYEKKIWITTIYFSQVQPEEKTKNIEFEFTITFLDKEKLIFHSLKKEDLVDIRSKFENKMTELALKSALIEGSAQGFFLKLRMPRDLGNAMSPYLTKNDACNLMRIAKLPAQQVKERQEEVLKEKIKYTR